jgi:hypothetical protein
MASHQAVRIGGYPFLWIFYGCFMDFFMGVFVFFLMDFLIGVLWIGMVLNGFKWF